MLGDGLVRVLRDLHRPAARAPHDPEVSAEADDGAPVQPVLEHGGREVGRPRLRRGTEVERGALRDAHGSRRVGVDRRAKPAGAGQASTEAPARAVVGHQVHGGEVAVVAELDQRSAQQRD